MKSTGGVEIANIFHGRSGGNNEVGGGWGQLDGVRPGKEWSPAGIRRWSAWKGEYNNWKSARDIILVPTSDVVIRPGPTEHSVIESIAEPQAQQR